MRAARLVHLLLLLQVHRKLTATQLAERLEVSVRTIYRDMEALSAAGVPVLAEPGPGGGCMLLDGYHTRLTGLTPDEAEALALVGLPGPAADLGLGTVLAAAQLKVDAALPPELRRRAVRVRERFHLDAPGWFSRADDTPHLATLARGVWEERQADIGYERAGGTVERTIHPLGLVLKAGKWYLVAGVEADRATRAGAGGGTQAGTAAAAGVGSGPEAAAAGVGSGPGRPTADVPGLPGPQRRAARRTRPAARGLRPGRLLAGLGGGVRPVDAPPRCRGPDQGRTARHAALPRRPRRRRPGDRQRRRAGRRGLGAGDHPHRGVRLRPRRTAAPGPRRRGPVPTRAPRPPRRHHPSHGHPLRSAPDRTVPATVIRDTVVPDTVSEALSPGGARLGG